MSHFESEIARFVQATAYLVEAYIITSQDIFNITHEKRFSELSGVFDILLDIRNLATSLPCPEVGTTLRKRFVQVIDSRLVLALALNNSTTEIQQFNANLLEDIRILTMEFYRLQERYRLPHYDIQFNSDGL